MAKVILLPELSRILELLSYDQETGLFRWRSTRARSAKAGMVAGCIDKRGYRTIRIDGRTYRASRLAFKVVNGRDPGFEVDHMDLDKGNDRPQNLRDATRSQNARNLPIRSDNKSGLKGVHWSRIAKKWTATISIDGKRKHLGTFDEKNDAYSAYCAAASRHYGAFARVS